MTGGETLIQCLMAQGVDAVFGMPGGHLEPIYDALYHHQDAIRHILVRNEQAASLMADGYARASGRPGVCLVIPGPGASNAATGMGEAASASSPVLLVTSGPEARLADKPASMMFHGLDHMAFFSAITPHCRRAATVEEIPGIVSEAFSFLRSGRPGPFVMEIPKDVLDQEAEPEIPGRVEPEVKLPGDDEVAQAVEAVAQAKRPILIAGGGVLFTDAYDLLGALAERLGAPVVTTQTARGALSDDHPNSLGDILDKAARTAIEEADLAIALGCRFVNFDTAAWRMELPRLVHIESEASCIGVHYETAVGIAADVRPTLERLLAHLAESDAAADWGGRIGELRAERQLEQDCPIVSTLRRATPPEAVVVGDVHMTAYRMRRAYKVTRPREYFASNSYCTLGYALPAALGAKVACPDRPVVSVSGDGGFVMTFQELATAAQFEIQVTAVIVNDDCLTSIKMGQDKRRDRRFIGVDLENPRFTSLAAAFGLRGYRADTEDELREALASAQRNKVTTVIEVPIEKAY